MTTFNTGNPIGSTDARDRSDNSENLDLAVNSLSPTFVDRLGVTRDTLEGIYQKSAYYRVGTFDAGYTLTNNRQTLAYGNIEYSWSGAFPKVVAAGSTPATTGGAWVDRTDETLRKDINNKEGLLTLDLINSSGLNLKTNEIIKTTGYATKNVGAASWLFTGNTGTPSQTPIQRGALQLTNADGYIFELVHDGIVTFEQIGSQGTMVQGSKPDHDSWDAFYLAFKISKAATESIEESQKIKFVATACTYYISKPMLLTNHTTYESNHVLGAFVYYGNQTLSASEISNVVQPGAPGNLDTYTGVTAHVMFWHVGGNYTRYARLVGFDFATAYSQIAKYGVFMPHANYCEIERCRFVNVQYGRYTRDTYFCTFKHLTYSAGRAAQGVYGEYILPRIFNGSNDNIGSGTSNTYENIGYNNFYASINSKNHLYSTFTNCYTEGALSQHAIRSEGDKLTFNSYGIENMGSGALSGDDGRILTASGGSELTINGIQAVYNVTIMKPEAIAVTGKHPITNKPTKVILNNPDMSGVLNDCTPFYSDDTALLSVTYPTLNGVITNWWIGLGKKSTYINPNGCLVLNSEYDSALVTFKNRSTFTYMFSDGTNMRIKYGTVPTSAKDGILIGGIETTTSENLASATDVINTTAKYAGKQVYNLTTFKPLWAGGSSATATWCDANGTVVITPT